MHMYPGGIHVTLLHIYDLDAMMTIRIHVGKAFKSKFLRISKSESWYNIRSLCIRQPKAVGTQRGGLGFGVDQVSAREGVGHAW